MQAGRSLFVLVALLGVVLASGCDMARRLAGRKKIDDLEYIAKWKQAKDAEAKNLLDEARNQYQELAEADPKNGQVRHRLAVVLVKQNKLTEAGKVFDEAIKLRPYDAELLTDLGAYQYRKNQMADAEASFQSALREKPAAARARNYLTRVLAEQKKTTELLAHLAPTGTRSQAAISAARELHKVGHKQEALALLESQKATYRNGEAKKAIDTEIASITSGKPATTSTPASPATIEIKPEIKTASLPTEIPPFEDDGPAVKVASNTTAKAPAFPDSGSKKPQSQPKKELITKSVGAIDPAFLDEFPPESAKKPAAPAAVKPEPTKVAKADPPRQPAEAEFGDAKPFPELPAEAVAKAEPPKKPEPAPELTDAPPFEEVAKAKPAPAAPEFEPPFEKPKPEPKTVAKTEVPAAFPDELPKVAKKADPKPPVPETVSAKKTESHPLTAKADPSPMPTRDDKVVQTTFPQPQDIGWQPAETGTAGDSGFEQYCPVCLLDDAKKTDASPAHTSSYAGRVYRFASPAAKAAFDRNPERYLPVERGLDVVLMKDAGLRVQGQVSHARWYKSRLYFFRTETTLKTFLANPVKYTE